MFQKVIALDIDGTLLWHHSNVSKETKEAVSRAAKRKNCIVLCTGRSFSEATEAVNQLDGSVSYVISSNGVSLRRISDGETLRVGCIPYRKAGQAVRLLNETKIFYQIYGAGKILCDRQIWKYFDDLHLDAHQTRVYTAYQELTEDITEWLGKNTDQIEKIMAFSRNTNLLKKLRDRIFIECGLKATVSDLFSLDIINPDVNKSRMLEMLCNKLSVLRDNVIAFGDGENDIEMINYAGLGVAMENAPQELKNAADYIAGNAWDDGVAKALNALVK